MSLTRADPRTLGALRIAAGLLVLTELAVTGGPVPLVLLAALAALVLIVGMAPRLAAVTAALVLAFLRWPAGTSLLLSWLLLGFAVVPSARRFSLQALLSSLRAHPERDVEELSGRPPLTVEPVPLGPALVTPLVLAGLVPAAFWDRLGRPRPHRARTVLFEAGCGICFQSVRILSRLDTGKLLRFVPNTEAESMGTSPELVERTIVVIDPASGAQTTRQLGFAEIFDALPWGPAVSWVLRAPGLTAIAGKVYDAVARNRQSISASLGLAACRIR